MNIRDVAGRQLLKLGGRHLVTTNSQTVEFLTKNKAKSFPLLGELEEEYRTFIIEAENGYLTLDQECEVKETLVGPFVRFELPSGINLVPVAIPADTGEPGSASPDLPESYDLSRNSSSPPAPASPSDGTSIPIPINNPGDLG